MTPKCHFGDNTPTCNPPAKIATGALGDLGKLSAALKATPTDYEAIRVNIDALAKDAQTALASRTKLGNVMNSLTLAQNKYEDLTISYKDQKSRLEDVDLLEVSSNLQYQETILQASLNVGQKIIQPSLLNYM
jgi:flagellar hook-associated protein 3 FlgL